MSRHLTSASTLENLKLEAKRWLKALRSGDTVARARLDRSHPTAPAEPSLRDVQYALAREHGQSGWPALKHEVATIEARRGGDARQAALEQLLVAAAEGDTAQVIEILARHPDIVSERAIIPGHTGLRTALHHAIDHHETVEALLSRGADPNVRDEGDDAMPLHFAAERGDLGVIRLLVEHGADPNVRDGKDCATPAGWAAYAGHDSVRDIILAGRIDPFQAIDFDLADRIPGIVQRDPWLLEKPFHEYATCASDASGSEPEPWHSPLLWAVVRNKVDAVRVLLEQGASQPAPRRPDRGTAWQIARDAGNSEVVELLERYRRIEETHDGRVRWFVKNACPDHDIRGGPQHVVARHTAARLLRQHPGIAGDSFITSVICGDLSEVTHALVEQPQLANARGGPKGWQPLLYLCFTRLPDVPAANENAVAIARLLLDHGADPDAYFMAGDSRYTPLVGAIGEGEEDRPAHGCRDELVRLLLDRGAEPYDIQVLYNIHFHGDALWFLELIHERSLVLGRAADWVDPDWRMLDMGGYGSGARYVLEMAIRHDNVALARWALDHGANPDALPPSDPRSPKHSLYEAVVRAGRSNIAALLLERGATRTQVAVDDEDAFMAACFEGDAERARALVARHPEFLESANAMIAAVNKDRAAVVALLLDLGVSIEIENKHRQRPLHHAAWANSLAVAALLIERGAEIDPVESEWHNTPLDCAVWSQHRGMIDLLAPHSRDIWNLVFVGAVDRLRALLAAEPALARTAATGGETPLMWLPNDEHDAAAIVRLFLDCGADARVVSGEGLTAADYASRRGLREAASLLRAAEDAAAAG